MATENQRESIYQTLGTQKHSLVVYNELAFNNIVNLHLNESRGAREDTDDIRLTRRMIVGQDCRKLSRFGLKHYIVGGQLGCNGLPKVADGF